MTRVARVQLLSGDRESSISWNPERAYRETDRRHQEGEYESGGRRNARGHHSFADQPTHRSRARKDFRTKTRSAEFTKRERGAGSEPKRGRATGNGWCRGLTTLDGKKGSPKRINRDRAQRGKARDTGRSGRRPQWGQLSVREEKRSSSDEHQKEER